MLVQQGIQNLLLQFENMVINNIVSGNEATISEENRLNNSTTYFWQVEGATESAVIISNT